MDDTNNGKPKNEQAKAATPEVEDTDAYYGSDEIGDGELDLSFLDESDDEAVPKPKDGSVG